MITSYTIHVWTDNKKMGQTLKEYKTFNAAFRKFCTLLPGYSCVILREQNSWGCCSESSVIAQYIKGE